MRVLAGSKRWREQSDNKPMDVWVESIPYRGDAHHVQNVLSFDLIYQHKLQQPCVLCRNAS